MDLIGSALLLFVAVVAVFVLFFDALCKVLGGAVAALARAPWCGSQAIRHRLRDRTRDFPQQAVARNVSSER